MSLNQTDTLSMERTRGNCTDVATKEWCDAHGYENNRPVGVSFKLTAGETECLLRGYVTLGAFSVSLIDGIYWGAFGEAAFEFFVACMSIL